MRLMYCFKPCVAVINITSYVNGAKFVARAPCITLSSKGCRKASDITTINAKPIGPELSKIHTRLSKIK